MKRVLILTDSLGCPREEINVAYTWTDKILQNFQNHSICFYTYCRHGLSAVDIDLTYVKEIEPDLIIIQVGIVDACRRAMSRAEVGFISHIHGLRTLVKNYCNKHHYSITRIRNIHYCDIEEFKKIINRIQEETTAKVVFLAIAPAGSGLVNKVYNIQKDISDYNDSIKSLKNVAFINPFLNHVNTDEFILDDGHHLSIKGENMVFDHVKDILSESMEGVG